MVSQQLFFFVQSEEIPDGDKEKIAATAAVCKKEKPGEVKRPDKDPKKEPGVVPPGVKQENKEPHHTPGTSHARAKVPESELVRDMKAQLK